MSLFFADLVREACQGTGMGDLPLAGALAGHRRFADVVPPGARFHYCVAGIAHPDEWETGEGEIGSGGSLVRLPLTSSAGGTAVDFSPGLKTVALTVAAPWFTARDDRNVAIADVEGLEAALAGKAALSGASFGGGISAPGLSIAGSPVVGARVTGWAAATGAASRATFNTSGATASQVAQRLKALINDLMAHGLIGS